VNDCSAWENALRVVATYAHVLTLEEKVTSYWPVPIWVTLVTPWPWASVPLAVTLANKLALAAWAGAAARAAGSTAAASVAAGSAASRNLVNRRVIVGASHRVGVADAGRIAAWPAGDGVHRMRSRAGQPRPGKDRRWPAGVEFDHSRIRAGDHPQVGAV